jgi:hypothetical protein
MFCLADMMTFTEVGVATARKAKAMLESKAPDAGKMVLVSRIFAAELAELMARNTMRITLGFGDGALNEIADRIDETTLAESCSGLINDMDAMADILFGRAS